MNSTILSRLSSGCISRYSRFTSTATPWCSNAPRACYPCIGKAVKCGCCCVRRKSHPRSTWHRHREQEAEERAEVDIRGKSRWKCQRIGAKTAVAVNTPRMALNRPPIPTRSRRTRCRWNSWPLTCFPAHPRYMTRLWSSWCALSPLHFYEENVLQFLRSKKYHVKYIVYCASTRKWR